MQANFNSLQDEKEFNKALVEILNLFGDKDKKVIQDAFIKRIGNVTSHPVGFINDKVNANEPGRAGYANGNVNGKMNLEWISSSGSINNAISQHYMRHELIHIFETAAHDALSLDKKIINAQGIPEVNVKQIGNRRYAAINGTIYREIITGESDNLIYGAGVCELFTDMMALMSKVNSGIKYKQQLITVDDIMKRPMEDWNIEGITTGYMSAFPIIRLMIAAFSNFPEINYQKQIDFSEGILFYTDNKTGKKKISNDFIYGSMCDPLFIAQECDRITGKVGSYFKLCNMIDKVVNTCAEHRPINMEDVQNVINELDSICALRMASKVADGSFSRQEAIKIGEEFEKQKVSVKEEFSKSLRNRR